MKISKLTVAITAAFCCTAVQAQTAGTENSTPDKRVFGVLPNYRTVDVNGDASPLTSKQKFRIAERDSFDWPGFLISGAFSGLYQLEDSNPSFGQGLKGYGKRYASAFADQVMGNMLAEGLLPSVFHEDPRYFRKGPGAGTGWSRTGYALTRIFVTRTDQGARRFNFSEVLGNSGAVAFSNVYYPDTRTASDNLQKLEIQLATDAFSNVLKEFWPDIKQKLANRHHHKI